MARRQDIASDFTLELDGKVSPNQLAQALNAFSRLLNGVNKHINPKEKIEWTVQVKEGSNLVELHPKVASKKYDLIGTIQEGLAQLEEGGDKPEAFNDNVMRHWDILRKIHKNDTKVRLWIGRKAHNVKNTNKENIKNIIHEEFEEYGAVEGKLQTLDAHDGKQFIIYELLHFEKILCDVKSDELFLQAHELFDKRVEVEGLIKYRSNGRPHKVSVERFNSLENTADMCDYKVTRGILEPYV